MQKYFVLDALAHAVYAPEVEVAMLTWVAWANNIRLLEPIKHMPPTESAATYDRQRAAQAVTL